MGALSLYGDNEDISYRPITGAGGDQPHNNMPPYRVIRFIEFVGF